ncbi:MAG: carbohydrate-binding domain-containing protein [Eubacteriales bacterium]
MKKLCLLLLVVSLFGLVACDSGSGDTTTTPTGNTTTPPGATTTTQKVDENSIYFDSEYIEGRFTRFDQETSVEGARAAITFSEGAPSVVGKGVVVSGKKATINQPGKYLISGSSSDGQLVVSVLKTEQVHLIFDGLTLTCSDSAPVWIQSVDKAVITLKAGTVNTLTDAAVYTVADPMPKACLYSQDDLTLNGTGSLIINANYNNGIGTKNDLKILSGTYTVTAANNAIKGNDSIAIQSGTFTITAGNDGFKTENDIDAQKGYLYIAGGSFQITAEDDGLQADQVIDLRGGYFAMQVGDDTVNCPGVRSMDVDVVIALE